MSQYRSIFLIADPSLKPTPGLERAGWLAQATGAALHVCLFERMDAIAASGLVNAQALEAARSAYVGRRREALEVQVQGWRVKGVRVTTEVCWTRTPLEEMLTHARELAPGLVVKDAVHEPLLKRVLFTPLDWQLMRACPAPLHLVNSHAQSVPRRVVAAVDVTSSEGDAEELNRKVVQAGMALAIQCDAALHLAHAFSVPPSVDLVVPGMALTDLHQRLRSSALRAFEAFADAHGVPAERRHFLDAPPAVALSEFANDPADVVVVGTARRGRLDRFLMGSEAERILDRLSCSALVIRP